MPVRPVMRLILLILWGGLLLGGVAFGPAGSLWSADNVATDLLLHLRLPRLLLASLEGAGLATAGLVLQTLFRNPLVDAGLLGISAGAGFGAAVSLSLGGGLWLVYGGAGLAAIAVLLLLVASMGYLARRALVLVLLVGIALNAFFGALLQLVLALMPATHLQGAMGWLSGSFAEATWGAVWPAFLVIVAGWGYLRRLHRPLDLMLLGRGAARTAGINTGMVERQLVIVTGLMVAVLVAEAGLVGFVGMMAPALVRYWRRGGHGAWFIEAPLVGAVLAVASDMLARYLMAPAELPVGVVTALLGAPAFAWLLWRQWRLA